MIADACRIVKGGWTMVWLFLFALFAFVSGCGVSLLLLRRDPS